MTNKFVHSIVMFLYYFVFVSVSFFVAPYLIEIGMNPATVGYLNSIGLFILILSLFMMGYITDTKYKNKTIISINLLITTFIFILFALVNNFNTLAILYILMWATFMVSTSLLDGLILKDIDEANFPKVRAMGSIGAAVSYLVNSVVLGGFSFSMLMILNALFLVVIIISLTKITEHEFDTKTSYKEGIRALKNNKLILGVLLISFLTYGVLAADDAYSYTFSVDIAGISALMMGVVGFLSIALEAVLMATYNPTKHRKYQQRLLIFITVILAFIFLSKGHMYESKFIINLGNILLGVFTGLFIPISIDLINQNTYGSVKNSVLSLYQTSIKLGGAILGLITANYIDKTNSLPGIYDIHLVITLIGIVCIIIFINERKVDA